MHRTTWLMGAAVAVAAGLASCHSYTPRPLIPSDVLARIERSRQETDGASTPDHPSWLSWPRALAYLRDRNPQLREARAAYRSAQALARVPTPLPDPTLMLGPVFGTHLEGGASRRLQPFVELGFTVPLSGRLGFQDAVHRAEARAAALDLIVVHRAAYLELRRLYTEWALTRESRTIREAVLASARRSLGLTHRLVEAGQAGALDVGLMELEVARRELDLLDAERDRLEIEEALSGLLGIAVERLGEPPSGASLPAVPVLPALAMAQETLVANHPALVRTRERYHVAERVLRLEVSKQYPDLVLGASFEGDPGETKKVWGLGVGMTLPVFDRNQQGIIVAEQARERVRADYEATLVRALASVEGAVARFHVLRRKHEAIGETMLPRSRANLDVALEAIRAGTFDGLRYLEVERAYRALRIEAVEVERAVRRLLAEVEASLGIPLGPLADEPPGAYPVLPDGSKTGEMDEENRP